MKKSTTGPTWVATVLKVLTFFVSSIYWQQASAACPVHNHLCTFHALGAKVDVTLPPGVTFNPANSLVIYAIGKDPVTGAASTVDFDNEAKLPTYTGDKFLAGNPANYTLSAGPYIVNTTTYGATHPPGTWSVPGDSGLQVTPSQYKNTFNANTAVAKHTGDFNGGENGNIPGATGCPNMPGAANCEAVVVTGNVPSGVYEQKVRLFNFYGVPDPKVDLQVGAYVTGQLVIVANSHDVNQVASFPKLEGTGNTTPTYQYEVYNRQFDPHAAGVATFDRMNWGKVRTVGNEYVQNGHRFRTQVQDSTTTRTKVYGDTGWAAQNTWMNSPKVVAPVYMGAEPRASIVPIPEISDRFTRIDMAFRPWKNPIDFVNIQVPYKMGVDVAAIEASNRLWIEQYALAQQELSKSALQLMQEGRWKEGGARFWDRLTDPEVAKASFSNSASDAVDSLALPYYAGVAVGNWRDRHSQDPRSQDAGFVLQEVGKGAVKDLTKMTVTLGQPINAGFSGIGAFAGTLIGDAWYSGSVNWANAIENGGAAVNKYNQDRATLSNLLESKNTSQEAGKVIGLLATGFIPIKGISTPELTPGLYAKVAPELPKSLALPAPRPQILIPEQGAISAKELTVTELDVGGLITQVGGKGLSEQLTILSTATLKSGNYSLGMATEVEANILGHAWVGDGFTYAKDGLTLISKSGLRTYRPPAIKFSPYAPTGVQANFERLEVLPGKSTPTVVGNGHLNITQ